MAKLTARKVETLREPGFYGDGEGLYLSVKQSGSKSWILRTVVRGKRRDLGIGSVAHVGLAQARTRAREMRAIAREGGDPAATQSSDQITLEDAVLEYHRIIEQSFTSEKHGKIWLSGLRLHVLPHLGDRKLDDIGTADVRRVLEPIWNTKSETARRLKHRLEAVFEWGRAEGHTARENPVYGIKRVLKPVRRNPKHHEALPWQDLPVFYERLAQREAMSALALRFIILTVSRSAEARLATWDELAADTWEIPGRRSKTRRPHRVPLAAEARRILTRAKGFDRHLVFPSNSTEETGRGKPLSINAFRPLYERMGYAGLTTHGFRSTFRDWCSEAAGADREVAEAALAHSVGQVERAYRRTDLFERRKDLMAQWSEYAASAVIQ